MAEQLQSLLERIQKDGVEKADAEAARIVQEARNASARTLREAEEKAATLVKKAEKDGELFAERGRRAVEQAARDVILSVHQAVTKTVETLVRGDVAGALAPEQVAGLIATLVKGYAAGETAQAVVPQDQQAAILKHVQSRLGQEAAKGLTLQGDARVLAGFRISKTGSKVEHDFTDAAITEAICKLLRPGLAELVQSGAKATKA